MPGSVYDITMSVSHIQFLVRKIVILWTAVFGLFTQAQDYHIRNHVRRLWVVTYDSHSCLGGSHS